MGAEGLQANLHAPSSLAYAEQAADHMGATSLAGSA
jgi:hypothetical protein